MDDLDGLEKAEHHLRRMPIPAGFRAAKGENEQRNDINEIKRRVSKSKEIIARVEFPAMVSVQNASQVKSYSELLVVAVRGRKHRDQEIQHYDEISVQVESKVDLSHVLLLFKKSVVELTQR